MIYLKKLLEGVNCFEIKGDEDVLVNGISYNSTTTDKNDVFVSIRGYKEDGEKFIHEAILQGVKIIVHENYLENYREDVTYIRVENSRRALAIISRNYFGKPDEDLILVGITGTKGKTSTSYMLKSILETDGLQVGIVGTVETRIGETVINNDNTTPESYLIFEALDLMRKDACQIAIIEVSSQGLMLDRVFGIEFDYGIFTNIGNDHIGKMEHGSFQESKKAKAKLFERSKIVVANCDDNNFREITSTAKCPIFTFGKAEKANLRIFNVNLIKEQFGLGVDFDLTGMIKLHIILKVPGEFNVYNSSAAALTAKLIGVGDESIFKGLHQTIIRGRAEKVVDNGMYSVVIDYAHNGLALKNLLEELSKYEPYRLVLVFGCGGNRDKNRRYDMGRIAGELADSIIVTSDNPRWEAPLKIILDILVGIGDNINKTLVIEDRYEAIAYAIENAKEGDLIVIAGKGHETYQIISGKKTHFDDREVVLMIEEAIENEKDKHRRN